MKILPLLIMLSLCVTVSNDANAKDNFTKKQIEKIKKNFEKKKSKNKSSLNDFIKSKVREGRKKDKKKERRSTQGGVRG